MRFIITSVKDKFLLNEEYLKRLNKYKLSRELFQEPNFDKSYMEEEYFDGYTIEIDSLEKLLDLKKELNEELILKDEMYTPELDYLHENILTILDGYLD